MDLYDLAAAEKAEAQLDAFVEKRARESTAEREREEMWKASVRTYHARRRERNREEWRDFHLLQAESTEKAAAELAASHRAKAESFLPYESPVPEEAA